jgi:hypothetical protein
MSSEGYGNFDVVQAQFNALRQRNKEKNRAEQSKSTFELEHIARTDKHHEVRIAAINQLSVDRSKSDLEHIARTDCHPRVRAAAVSKLLG